MLEIPIVSIENINNLTQLLFFLQTQILQITKLNNNELT
jgi:hypothetical protein